MYQSNLPLPRAYKALIDTTLGVLSFSKAGQFALTWIAAARMVALGTVPELTNMADLNAHSSWIKLQKAGLPVDGMLSMFEPQSGGLPSPEKPVRIVTELQKELGNAKWDILPTIVSTRRPRSEDDVFNDVIPSVAELLLDLVGIPSESDLWLPFDRSGMLTIRALRRGWKVNAAQMMGNTDTDALKLLLAIEYGTSNNPDVKTEILRDSDGYPSTKASNVIAIPPSSLRVQNTNLLQWGLAHGGTVEQFNRSELMAVYELLHRVAERAVFLLPASVLFTSGQDQRLREFIMDKEYERRTMEAVIAMPVGVFLANSIASAALVFDSSKGHLTRLVDLGVAKRSARDVEQTILEGHDLALGLTEDVSRACFVTPDACRANDYVLSPSRYLAKKVTVGANAIPLGNLCELIRPPAQERGEEGEKAIEVGIQELIMGGWNKLNGAFDKWVTLRQSGKGVVTLKGGDLLFSVKGTVGKVGLLKGLAQNKVVASQSCIGLRMLHSEKTVSPEYLLMYLRSEEGQAQLDALKVGSTVHHINITTLLESFQVPVPDQQAQQLVVDDYVRLCNIEREITQLEERCKTITKSRWTMSC